VAWKEADMAPVDVKRVFHSMTLPPPSGTAHEWPAPIPVEEVGGVAIPIGEEPDQPECGELSLLGEEDSQVRQVVELLAVILHQRPQPLSLVMDLLSCTLDLPPGCAAGLFWRAQEHGYVSLRHGIVHLDRLPLRQ